MAAVLFGSISTIADTSELQREAYNRAFEAHGLGWHWTREQYVSMLGESGGQNRLARYANSVGQTVDAPAVHRTKSEIFQRSLADSEVPARAGVAETVRGAKDQGIKLALVTTTSQENVAALMRAVRPSLPLTDFDVVVDASSVDRPKPDPAAYSFALQHLGEQADACVAIEDNPDGMTAATAAGVRCLAFPNENTAGLDFPQAEQRVDHLDFAALQRLVGA